MTNLAHLLADRAGEHPEREALFFEGGRLSYGELDRRAAVAAGALRKQGVRTGDRVALSLPNTPAYVAAYFGILRLGAIAVPLNILLAEPEVESRLEVAAPSVCVDRPLPIEGDAHLEIVERTDDDPAALLFTPGTTGRPEGAILTHGRRRARPERSSSAASISARCSRATSVHRDLRPPLRSASRCVLVSV